MRLRELLDVLPDAAVAGPIDGLVGKVCSDSRLVERGDVFVALRGGQQQDRHRFIDDAIGRGAAAVVVEEEVPCSATRIVVASCRAALPRIARRLFGAPSDSLLNIGVTGTNGKTTTAYIVSALLRAAGMPCGYLGTLGCGGDGPLEKMANTTPEADVLQGALRRLVDEGMRAVSLEVSSHGLALQRVDGIDFHVAIFTNITRDHLDYHGDFSSYLAAKSLLFEGLKSEAFALLNADDPHAADLAKRTDAQVVRYGLSDAADWYPVAVDMRCDGMKMQVASPFGTFCVQTSLTGRFNCYNVTAALAAASLVGVDKQALCDGLASIEGVPGRFELLHEGQEFTVIVDYAHTPDALERALQSARPLTDGKVLCVFGCGGDRDRGKRALMGRVAAQWADGIWLTSDNPRSEDPEAILDEIALGMPNEEKCEREVDRYRAIDHALRTAGPGDVVLIAGKGHESEQILSDRVISFDDRDVARSILKSLERAN